VNGVKAKALLKESAHGILGWCCLHNQTEGTDHEPIQKLITGDSPRDPDDDVNDLARHDLDRLLSSGLEVNSTNHTPGPLDQPAIKNILNQVSGQLTVRGQGVLNGRMDVSGVGGKTWTDLGTFHGARRRVLKPVTPGLIYLLQFCAPGGSTCQSPWSNPVSIMAT